jgi:5'-3' exonuclease
MGIKNLTQFLKKHDVYETLSLSNLKYTKIGIDVPMFLYKFKSAYAPNDRAWLGSFINFIAYLRKWDVHPVFVFEGKAPFEKFQTQSERREQRQKIVDKTNSMQLDLDEYMKNGTVTPLLMEMSKKLKEFKTKKSLLVKNTSTVVNVDEIRDEINRRRKYEISITNQDIEYLKNLCNLMGTTYIHSSGEAETDCVSLFYGGAIDYIVSEDTDVLAYFSTHVKKDLKVITNFNNDNNTFVQVSKQKILDLLNLSSKSFRDFCIMCGTDYNKNIFRVGIENSYKFISNYHYIENVPLDISILNHINVRKLFTVKINLNLNEKVKWCRFPSFKFIHELDLFIFTHNLNNINVDNIYSALSEPDIDLEDDNC